MGEENAIVQADPELLNKQQKTAKAKEERIARLAKHKFKPGQSGNMKGRPPKGLPNTDETRWIQTQEVPMVIRMKLQAALRYEVEEIIDGKPVKHWVDGEALPKKLTHAEAKARGKELAIWGLINGFEAFIEEKTREVAEGKVADRVEIIQEADPAADLDSVKRVIYGKFTEMALERARMFNMPLPGIQEVADEAGIGDKLGIPREPTES